MSAARKEGWLQKRGPVNGWKWKWYYCVLEDDKFVYYAGSDCSQKSGSITLGPVAEVQVVKDAEVVEEKPFTFMLGADTTGAPSYFFAAKSDEELKEWLEHLRAQAGNGPTDHRSRSETPEVVRLQAELRAAQQARDEAEQRVREQSENQTRALTKMKAICESATEAGSKEQSKEELLHQMQLLREQLQLLPAEGAKVASESTLPLVNRKHGRSTRKLTWNRQRTPSCETQASVRSTSEKLSLVLQEAEDYILEVQEDPAVAALSSISELLTCAVNKIHEGTAILSKSDTFVSDMDINDMMKKEASGSKEGDDQGTASTGTKEIADFINAQFMQRRVSVDLSKFKEKSKVDFKELTTNAIATLSSPVMTRLAEGHNNWGFDFFKIIEENPDASLLKSYGTYKLVPTCTSALGCTKQMVSLFLEKLAPLCRQYGNPYHNDIHAVQVCHLASWLINLLGVQEQQTGVEKSAFAIAVLCHDVKHFGRNNGFCVATEHPLALLYNDSKVLENMHAATCFELLQSSSAEGQNMLGMLTREDRSSLRSQIIEYILATDMSEHFEMLSKFRVRSESTEFSLGNQPDRLFLTKMCIKAGDIGHASLPWDLHNKWSVLVTKEFFQQGDEEKALNLPFSPLCDRSTVDALGKSQQGFLNFVVLPLYEALERHEGAQDSESSEPPEEGQLRKNCIQEIQANAKRWVEDPNVVAVAKEQLQPPPAVAKEPPPIQAAAAADAADAADAAAASEVSEKKKKKKGSQQL
eukprot:TRINITY_DN15543_c0_g1_i1.p1 TRINITY_DN15543_c0_g1~~TRINITY_DN15543_c0_g1_i1.p1  ORF type:complete len:754 (-),score=171.13 TRINITY_DN15543_c0_g1_i1:52-2313(-)